MNQSNMHTKQKRNKRMISMLLLATLLISLFIISDIKPASADDTMIDNVWMMIDFFPYQNDGEKRYLPSDPLSLMDKQQDDIEITFAQWVTVKDGIYVPIEKGKEIIAGETYILQVILDTVYSGDKISSSGNFHLHNNTGTSGSYYDVGDRHGVHGYPFKLMVYFKCTAQKGNFYDQVEIRGVKRPFAGETPQLDVSELTCDESKIKLLYMGWIDEETGTFLKPTDKFQKGRNYELNIAYDKNYGDYLKFAAKVFIDGKSGFSGYLLNDVEGFPTNTIVGAHYYCLQKINTISISGLPEPIDGEKPNTDVNNLTYDNSLFNIDQFTWVGVRDDGSYYNMGDEKFFVGKKYAASFVVNGIEANDYVIDLNTTKGEVNGNEATLSKDGNKYLVRATFTAKPQSGKTYIESLHVTLPDECLPVVGQEPEWDVSKYSLQNPPEGVSIKRVEWLKLTTPLKKGDIFQKDEKYTIAFFLDIPEKYVAKSGVTKGHVNSIRTDFLVVKDGPFITYYLTALDTPKTSQKPEQPQQPQQPSQPSGNQQYTMHFSDVMPSDWYYNYVKYVYEKGIMNGVGDGKFAPKNNVSRAMIVTMLYRIAKEPAVGGTTNFNDNTGNTWYTNAVKWTAQKGLAKEFIQGNFDPNTLLTREQMITIMYNYQKSRGKSTALANSLGEFKDGYLVSGYAQEPMKWAVKAGIIQGNEQKKLNPTANVTRAEVAAIIQRFNELR